MNHWGAPPSRLASSAFRHLSIKRLWAGMRMSTRSYAD